MSFISFSRALLSAAILTSCALAQADTVELTPAQIEQGISRHINTMQTSGAFTLLAQCSGKAEATLVDALRPMLLNCYQSDPENYDACYVEALSKLTGLSEREIDACAGEDDDEPY